MHKKLLIIGGDGHGSVIASCIKDNQHRYGDYEWVVEGFLNDYYDRIDNYPVLGGTNDIAKFVSQGYYFAWGIHLIGRNAETFEAFNRIRVPQERLATIIHHSAFIGENVILDPGCFVMANTYIAPRTHIGMCTMIKANVNVGHDVECGPLCHFAMGSIVGSFTHLGVCANVAIGSVVLEHCNIGDFSMLGAHSLLTHNIPAGDIYVGSPAKFHKKIKFDNMGTKKCLQIGGG